MQQLEAELPDGTVIARVLSGDYAIITAFGAILTCPCCGKPMETLEEAVRMAAIIKLTRK